MKRFKNILVVASGDPGFPALLTAPSTLPFGTMDASPSSAMWTPSGHGGAS